MHATQVTLLNPSEISDESHNQTLQCGDESWAMYQKMQGHVVGDLGGFIVKISIFIVDKEKTA